MSTMPPVRASPEKVEGFSPNTAAGTGVDAGVVADMVCLEAPGAGEASRNCREGLQGFYFSIIP